MFYNNTKKTIPGLDKAIDDILFELNNLSASSEEYSRITDQLEKLYKIKIAERPDRVSKDAAWAVVGNLIGIVAIINFEHAHVITTKALGFIGKVR